ncbi:MAG: hypothetical protein LJE88_04850 [Deltaproteobacteria bacterium]|nr:hypothetical protein [Deltaproteobacteria bacterium]
MLSRDREDGRACPPSRACSLRRGGRAGPYPWSQQVIDEISGLARVFDELVIRDHGTGNPLVADGAYGTGLILCPDCSGGRSKVSVYGVYRMAESSTMQARRGVRTTGQSGGTVSKITERSNLKCIAIYI